MNPLSDLIKSFGLDGTSLAQLLDLDAKSVAQAISDEPSPVLSAFIAIERAIHLKHSLVVTKPLRFWVDKKYVDDLHKDNEFRKLHGFLPVHEKVEDLVAMLRRLRTNDTVRALAARLERNYVPTWQGHMDWRGSTVQHFTNRWNPKMDRDTRSEPKETFKRHWRHFVIHDWWIMNCYPGSGWPAKFGWEMSEEDDRLVYSTRDKIPVFIDEIVVKKMSENEWMRGHWGFCST